MQPRIEYDKFAPDGVKTMWGPESYVRRCGLEPALLDLASLPFLREDLRFREEVSARARRPAARIGQCKVPQQTRLEDRPRPIGSLIQHEQITAIRERPRSLLRSTRRW